MKRLLLTLITVITSITYISAQSEMYEWKLYSSYSTPQQIVEGRNEVYFLADSYLFSYDKDYSEIREIDCNNLLSDTDITLMRYNYDNDQLVIVYSNSNIDIIEGGHTYNIPYIKSAVITGSKGINNITFSNSTNEIYVSTDFGIVIINSTKHEIKTTFNLGIKIYDATVFNDKYYMLSSDQSLYSCPTSGIPYTLDSWTWCAFMSGIQLMCDGTQIWVRSSSALYQYVETNSPKSTKIAEGAFTSLNINREDMIYTYDGEEIRIYNSDTSLSDNIEFTEYMETPPTDVSCNNKSNLYWCVDVDGVKSYKRWGDTLTGSSNIPMLSYPAVPIPLTLEISDGVLYTAPAGVGIYNEDFTISGANIAKFSNYKWSNIYGEDIPWEISPYKCFALPAAIAIDPSDSNTIYVGTWFDGVYKIVNGEYNAVWNYTNSPITGQGDNWLNSISALAFDSDKNLWMANFSDDQGIVILKPDGTFATIDNYQILDKKYMSQILIPTQSTTKWVISQYDDSFVFAININGTIDSTSDDVYKKFSTFTDQDGKTIDGTTFYCAAEDLDGSIWIGTDRGPITITNPNNFNSSSFTCYRVKIPRDDGTSTADYLLNDEVISAIAVDGANQKWIGTQGSGVYLVSEDGLETLYQFDTSNSVLPSDVIYDIKVNNITGEVFFATEGGLASFRAEATAAKDDYSSIYVFPNPVPPTHYGVITVSGLMYDSLVKITDTQGNLIYQNYSQGGQLVWNGYGTNGSRVKSGVYYVWVSNFDGDAIVSKFVVIN